jgi:stage V sporulation protein SpoVS
LINKLDLWITKENQKMMEEPNEEMTEEPKNKIEEEIKEEAEAEEIKEEEYVTALKVKADSSDISAEDRKRNVKKLAGAIAHSLRAHGEINVRCFGPAAIGKAAKALAIAKNYVGVQQGEQKLQLSCSPAFITTKINDSNLTGICFCTFATKQDEEDRIIEEVKSVLMVKSDPKDLSAEERKIAVKKLAGAIAHSLEENKEAVIRCFGNSTIGKAAKALAIARGYTATRGPDLYCWPTFIVADINGSERTGIAFYAYTNEI